MGFKVPRSFMRIPVEFRNWNAFFCRRDEISRFTSQIWHSTKISRTKIDCRIDYFRQLMITLCIQYTNHHIYVRHIKDAHCSMIKNKSFRIVTIASSDSSNSRPRNAFVKITIPIYNSSFMINRRVHINIITNFLSFILEIDYEITITIPFSSASPLVVREPFIWLYCFVLRFNVKPYFWKWNFIPITEE